MRSAVRVCGGGTEKGGIVGCVCVSIELSVIFSYALPYPLSLDRTRGRGGAVVMAARGIMHGRSIAILFAMHVDKMKMNAWCCMIDHFGLVRFYCDRRLR